MAGRSTPRGARRRARWLLVPGAAAVTIVTTAPPAGAHAVTGGELPAPNWLLGYVGAFLVVITAVALRASWTGPRLATTARAGVTAGAAMPVGDVAGGAARGRAEPGTGAGAIIGHAIGLAALAAVVVAAIVGPDTGASNIAPVAVFVVWWVGLPIAAFVLGDVMATISPFPLVATAARRLVPTREGRALTAAPSWTAAGFLFGFGWFFLAYHRPGSPRVVAVMLVAYVLAVAVGTVRWGRAWARTGEAFGAISALVARLSWRRPSEAIPAGTAAIAVVWVGGSAFDAFASTSFWVDVLGTSTGWSRTALNTVGLVWITAIVAAAYLLATTVAERVAGIPARSLARPLGVALVPLALAWFVAHDLTLLLFEGQNFLTLLSDPIGRGWDLLGTIDRTPDYGIVDAQWVRWTQLAVLGAGHVGAVVLGHDLAQRAGRGPRAMAVTWAMTVLAAASVVAAALLVLAE